jgi:hypothetical protein
MQSNGNCFRAKENIAKLPRAIAQRTCWQENLGNKVRNLGFDFS